MLQHWYIIAAIPERHCTLKRNAKMLQHLVYTQLLVHPLHIHICKILYPTHPHTSRKGLFYNLLQVLLIHINAQLINILLYDLLHRPLNRWLNLNHPGHPCNNLCQIIHIHLILAHERHREIIPLEPLHQSLQFILRHSILENHILLGGIHTQRTIICNIPVKLNVIEHLHHLQHPPCSHKHLYPLFPEPLNGILCLLRHLMCLETHQCTVNIKKYRLNLILHLPDKFSILQTAAKILKT